MEINYQRIYEHAGYLFYAIAAADGTVKDAEVAVFKDLVNKEWLPLEDSTDEFGTDSAHYIFISFDNFLDRGVPAEEAFASFKNYFNDHNAAFTAPIRKKISTTAAAIASAFGGKNKAESNYMTELKRIMK